MTTEAKATEEARSAARTYDLALQSGRQGFTWGFNNHGITVADDRLDWIIGGTADAAQLASIAAINLRSGGSWQSPLAQCRITFRDGLVLTVSDAAWSGHKESKQAVYRQFVHDLHRRLAALPGMSIFYTSGFTKTQFHVVSACTLFFVAMCFIPLIALLARPDLEYVYVFFAAGALVWPLLRMLYNNAPGIYDPRQIPPQILP